MWTERAGYIAAKLLGCGVILLLVGLAIGLFVAKLIEHFIQ